jgi:thiamine biosynthesis protein ThiC
MREEARGQAVRSKIAVDYGVITQNICHLKGEPTRVGHPLPVELNDDIDTSLVSAGGQVSNSEAIDSVSFRANPSGGLSI